MTKLDAAFSHESQASTKTGHPSFPVEASIQPLKRKAHLKVPSMLRKKGDINLTLMCSHDLDLELPKPRLHIAQLIPFITS